MDSAQASLLDWAPTPGGSGELRRFALFRRFHRENPHVYRELVSMARDAKAKGATKLGMRMLFEVLRWSHIQTRRDEGAPKLNDWFAPYFARLIMQQERDLAGVFETRGRQ